MLSWRPKPFRLHTPIFRLNRGQARRALRIKRYVGETSKDAAKTAARYKHKPSASAKDSSLSETSITDNTRAEIEQAPQDVIRKIFFGRTEDTDENIAAYEQRHQKFLEILKGANKPAEDSGSTGEQKIKGRHRKTGRRSPIVVSIAGKDQGDSGNEDQKLRRLRSFFAQTKSPDGFGRFPRPSRGRRRTQPETNTDKRPRSPKTRDLGVSGPRLSKETGYVFPGKRNLWSQMSSRKTRRVEDRSEFEPAIADEAPKEVSKRNDGPWKIPKRKLSLFEELFPEEARERNSTEADSQPQDKDIPKLSLPVFDEDDSFDDEYMRGRKQEVERQRAASKEQFRLWNPSVLVLQTASPSLIDSDFRRIAPKGQHINEWTGPVIPARDPQTLAQQTHYFLVFPNPAYARAYQNHVDKLHTLTQTHTPKSIESPMPPPKGMLVKGQDVYSLLQDYTLVPPSQQLPLRALTPPPPLSSNLLRLLRNKGYPEITQPQDKTGKSVLFWVEGFVPTIEQVQQLILRDGRARGMAWALTDGKDSIQQLDPKESRSIPNSNTEDNDNDENAADWEREAERREGPGFRDYVKRTRIRWTIAFEDENEARRFVRRWHLRAFSEAFGERVHRGDHRPLCHVEFLW